MEELHVFLLLVTAVCPLILMRANKVKSAECVGHEHSVLNPCTTETQDNTHSLKNAHVDAREPPVYTLLHSACSTSSRVYIVDEQTVLRGLVGGNILLES